MKKSIAFLFILIVSTVIGFSQKEYTVSDINELIEVLGSNRTIYLEPGEYIIKKTNERIGENDSISLFYGLYLKNIHNLSLIGSKEGEVHFIQADPLLPVMEIKDCTNLSLENLKAGHGDNPGDGCAGNCLAGNGCTKLRIENCHLYGSGVKGFDFIYINDLFVKNSVIYECTSGLFYLVSGSNVNIENCIFKNNKSYSGMVVGDIEGFSMKNCTITENTIYPGQSLFNIDDCKEAVFQNCTFNKNKGFSLDKDETRFKLIDCIIEDNEPQDE